MDFRMAPRRPTPGSLRQFWSFGHMGYLARKLLFHSDYQFSPRTPATPWPRWGRRLHHVQPGWRLLKYTLLRPGEQRLGCDFREADPGGNSRFTDAFQ